MWFKQWHSASRWSNEMWQTGSMNIIRDHEKAYLMPYANNKGAVQPAHWQSDQCLFCLLLRQNDTITGCNGCIQSFNTLASFCSWTGRFESYLVVNPPKTFSHEVAQLNPEIVNQSMSLDLGSHCLWVLTSLKTKYTMVKISDKQTRQQ